MTRLNAKSSNRNVLLIGTVIAAVLIALVVFAVRPAGSAGTGTKTFELTGQPVLGQAAARVTLVVFEDFKCPNCKRFEEETFPVIQSKYIGTGKVRFSMLPFPFIAQQNSLPVDYSRLAAEAALYFPVRNTETPAPRACAAVRTVLSMVRTVSEPRNLMPINRVFLPLPLDWYSRLRRGEVGRG